MSNRVSREAIQRRYDQQLEIWPAHDRWHQHLRRRYVEILSRTHFGLRNGACVLNLGSAGADYGIAGDPHIFVDLSATQLPKNGLSVVADIHQLPIRDGAADLVLAIGSVLNYCSALEALQQISFACAPGAHLLFDFEQSGAFEHLGHAERNSDVFFGRADYAGAKEGLWYYSLPLVVGILTELGFSVDRVHYIHIFSSLAYGLTRSERFAAKFVRFDRVGSKLPLFRRGASTIMILARKLP